MTWSIVSHEQERILNYAPKFDDAKIKEIASKIRDGVGKKAADVPADLETKIAQLLDDLSLILLQSVNDRFIRVGDWSSQLRSVLRPATPSEVKEALQQPDRWLQLARKQLKYRREKYPSSMKNKNNSRVTSVVDLGRLHSEACAENKATGWTHGFNLAQCLDNMFEVKDAKLHAGLVKLCHRVTEDDFAGPQFERIRGLVTQWDEEMACMQIQEWCDGCKGPAERPKPFAYRALLALYAGPLAEVFGYDENVGRGRENQVQQAMEDWAAVVDVLSQKDTRGRPEREPWFKPQVKLVRRWWASWGEGETNKNVFGAGVPRGDHYKEFCEALFEVFGEVWNKHAMLDWHDSINFVGPLAESHRCSIERVSHSPNCTSLDALVERRLEVYEQRKGDEAAA